MRAIVKRVRELRYTGQRHPKSARIKRYPIEKVRIRNEENQIQEGGSGINDEIVEGNTIQCRVLDNVLSVSNLKTGDKIELYSAAGALVASQVATSNKETLPLNGKGFYIVRVGTTSVKVTNN